jgi:hypothetical protein
MTATAYDNWKKRLEVAKLPTVAARRAELTRLGLNSMEPTMMDAGYYRIPQTVKDASGNGKNVITGYVPVALWSENGAVVGVRGQDEMTPEQIVDGWTWFCSHPISYDLYQAVAERGEPWPDISATPEDEPAGTRLQENQPPAEDKPALPAHERFAAAIDAAISAAATLIVDSTDADAIAQGSKNRIAEIRLAGEKVGKREYEPMHAAYVEVRDRWLKPVNRATVAEKAIQTKILTFRESERKRVAAEQAEAARVQREKDEANERAAQRAIASGAAEPPPVVEAPPPVTPAPAAAAPTYGSRTVKSELKKFAVIENDVEVYKHFAAYPDVQELLQKLATNAIRNGQTVPGATFREGLV